MAPYEIGAVYDLESSMYLTDHQGSVGDLSSKYWCFGKPLDRVRSTQPLDSASVGISESAWRF